jgi:hypothetical protein
MGDDGWSLTAGAEGFVGIRCPAQRDALIDACDCLIECERQSQRDGLLPEEVDRSLDQLTDASALRERLGHGALALAVPLSIVPALIDELAERVHHAKRSDAVELAADLSELLGQLERLPVLLDP